MKNNMEKRIIEGKKRDKDIEAFIPQQIEGMFKGLQDEGEYLQGRKYAEEKLSKIVRNPKYPTLDEQEGNYGDDEKLEEDVDDEEGELKEL